MAESYAISAYFTKLVKPRYGFLPEKHIPIGKSSLKLNSDPETMKLASKDYGNMVREYPAAVLSPTSVHDINELINIAYKSRTPFTIAARGRGHSVRGQAMARDGIVVDMEYFKNFKVDGGIKVSWSESLGYFADVGGEQLWIDVLESSLRQGLSPASWTDYLYLSVGGTLSQGGISGQTFRYGPQISNVYEIDVITGTGEFVTCNSQKNSELFYAALGGLGQFGIITRARIPLDWAPKRVKWVRMLYSDFAAFTRDQEHLISINGRRQKNALDYLEGSLLLHQGSLDNWRSSFFPLSDHPRIISLVTKHGIIYSLEMAKYYDGHAPNEVDKDLQILLEGLSYIPECIFTKDVSYKDFLNRVRSGELKLQSQGLWDVPHPWLNLFVPKSRILDFDDGVFRNIILKGNITTGPVIIYPMNRNKWDDRASMVIPDEEVFYTVGFLHSSGFDGWHEYDQQNEELLNFCENAGIKIKQYLPHYSTKEEWKKHFGSKWKVFQRRKAQFDPKMILSPGQRIFNN